MNSEQLAQFHSEFSCKFPAAIEHLPEALEKASQILTTDEMKSYVVGANFIGSIGQGVEPVITYLDEMPQIISVMGIETVKIITDYSYKLARSPNKMALVSFLVSFKSVCQRYDDIAALQQYLALLDELIQLTRTVIHGNQSMHASAALMPLLQHMQTLISQLDLAGIRHFIQYGARNFNHQPQQQIAYFSLQSLDAKSLIHSQRKGTQFVHIEHKLHLYTECLWDKHMPISAFVTGLDHMPTPIAYMDNVTIALPDVLQGHNHLSGINHYRAILAHLMAHKRWSSKLMADNYAPLMRLFICVFEDCRIDVLAMRKYPGLRKYFLALHPLPDNNLPVNPDISYVKHRALRLSRALIDAEFDPENALIQAFREKFTQLLSHEQTASSQQMAVLGSDYFIQSRLKSDNLSQIYFDNTEVSYRDDNRCMWSYHEEYDEADEIPPSEYSKAHNDTDDPQAQSVFYYPEWDYVSKSYRPNWVTVYESLHPASDSRTIDAIMHKHKNLSKRLKAKIERLKPQNRQPKRFQPVGNELDIDAVIKSVIDLNTGHHADDRIYTSHSTHNRSIALMILVDLSASLNNKNPATGQTLLTLSQEALAISAWTVAQLGDKFAIAGFHSNTRSRLNYQHILGFSEKYDDTVKARIANLSADYSTRMGAAMRHAAHYLHSQKTEKKLMLILTDGEPADIDAKDPLSLIKDSKQAVLELHAMGIYSYCISLDKNADEYVQDIFANHYTVIDKIEKLPEKLAQIFLQLTH